MTGRGRRRTIWAPKNASAVGRGGERRTAGGRRAPTPKSANRRRARNGIPPLFVNFRSVSAAAHSKEGERNRGRINRRPKTAMEWWRLERKGRSKELEMRTAAGTTTGSDGMTKVK